MAKSLRKLIVSGRKNLRKYSEVAKGFKWIFGATKEFGAAIWTRDQLYDDITSAKKKISKST